MENNLVQDKINELNNKLDALLGLFLPWYLGSAMKSETWVVGYLSDCGLTVEYIATITGLNQEEVRKEKVRAKERKLRRPSFWDKIKEE